MRVYLHSFGRCWLPKTRVTQNSEKIWTYNSSTSSKVINLNANRKRTCDFLLVRHSNRGHILRNSEIRRLIGWKLRIFATLSHLASPLLMFPLEFHCEAKRQETRLMGLFCGESCMILTSTTFDWSTLVTDGRTDERAICCRALKIRWRVELSRFLTLPFLSYLWS